MLSITWCLNLDFTQHRIAEEVAELTRRLPSSELEIIICEYVLQNPRIVVRCIIVFWNHSMDLAGRRDN